MKDKVTTRKNNKLIIYGRIPSKKNSKIWTGKYLISSKAYREREKEQSLALANHQKYDYPVEMHYEFYRPDKRRTDMDNKITSIQDLLVHNKILLDDDYTHIPYKTSRSICVDKENPRVEIIIKKYLWKSKKNW